MFADDSKKNLDAADKRIGTAGVILAAGMSSRMGQMKMLLPLGGSNIIKYGVSTLLQAGVSPVVVVTGRDAVFVRDALKDLDVEFVHNENFSSTQMFDSAKMGFEKVKGRCERVLFTPGDIPLFGSEILKDLVDSKASVAIPICNGKTGHPVCIDEGLLSDIIAYDGEGGLKGALSKYKNVELIDTENKGVLMDADTPDDYEKLLNFYESMK